MNQKPNAVKATLDNGRSYIIETISTPSAIAKLRLLGKVSASGHDVAYTAKVHYDFTQEVVK